MACHSSVEFEAKPQEKPWHQQYCVHCHEPIGLHWQTADGRIWCVDHKKAGEPT